MGYNPIPENTFTFCNIPNNEVYIFGEIDDDMSFDIIMGLNTMILDDRRPVTIYIQSPGGSISSGIAIVELLLFIKKAGVKVITIAMGECCSMAALIFLLGDNRLIGKHCYYMLHDFLTGSCGEYVEIHNRELETVRSWFNEFVWDIIKDTKLTKKMLEEKWNKTKTLNWYITPVEAIKLNIAHEIFNAPVKSVIKRGKK